jgi:CheY-like chemotaxis protein
MAQYRILVADDDDSLRDVLSEFLTRLGFRVVEAADGQAAMRAVREEGVFLSILDFHMRGTTALDVLRAMQERLVTGTGWAAGTMPCIVVSAGATREEQQAAIAQGAFRFLSKPFAVEHLVQSVQDAVRAFQQRGLPFLGMDPRADWPPLPFPFLPPQHHDGRQP